jgi:hypothetical protein
MIRRTRPPVVLSPVRRRLGWRFVVVGLVCATQAWSAEPLREPSLYPHDMTTFGCSHRDESSVCDQAPAPPPDSYPLVGTWVRFTLLRNGFSMQPPDAPLYLTFAKDGYWSMMEFFADRPRIGTALAEQSPAQLRQRFARLAGGFGVFRNDGQVNFRHLISGLQPADSGSVQERTWRFEGNVLVLEGVGPTRSPQTRMRKLPNQPLDSKALVGSWERTSYIVDGKRGTTVPERLILGEDGWFMATTLPPGRPTNAGKPQADWSVDDFVVAFEGVEASRGTYNADSSRLIRRHIGDVDPALENRLSSGTYRLVSNEFVWTGTDARGRAFVSTYRRLPPRDIFAPPFR